MKKLFILFFLAFMTAEVSGQGYDLSKRYPKYEGYRPFTYYQDTVRYLKYNWGLGAAGACSGQQLSEFFDRFELPIYAVRLYFSSWSGPRLVAMELHLVPNEKFQKADRAGLEVNRYVIFVMAERRDENNIIRRLTYDEVSPYFPGLKKEGKTLYPWKDSYKEILGKCWVDDIQYNFEVTGEPF